VIRPELEKTLIKALSHVGSATSDFDLNPDIVLPTARKLTPAAVLICVRRDASVILTKRSAKLKNHPGQIAFPGGRVDPTDPSLEAAALREAREEIGLPDGSVKVLGTLPNHETVTGFIVTPVLALLQRDFEVRPELGEVSEVFDAPLFHLLEPKNYQIQHRRYQGIRRQYYTVPYGPYYIWGATARMLYGLAKGVKP